MRLISVLTSSLLILLLSVSAAFADGQKATSDLLDVLKAKGVLDDASYDSLKKKEAVSPTPAASTLQLLDVLRAKGVLGEEDYNRLSREAAPAAVPAVATNPAPAAVPVAETVTAPAPEQATAAVPAPTAAASPVGERPIDGTLTKVEDSFARVTGDIVRLKIDGYIQAGYLNDDAGFSYGLPPTTDFSPTSGNQFFVRRARLGFNFNVGEKIGAKVQIEPAVDLFTSSSTSGGRSILRDAYVWTDYIPYTRITLGQFKTPFGLEGVESLSDNPTINRSMVTGLAHSLLRDIGVMAAWKFNTDVSGLPLGAQWAVALVNGTGYNLPDDNDQKDIVFRGTVNPLVEGLNIGGSLYGGKTHVTPTAGAAFNKYHDSWAAEAEYVPPFLKGLKLRGEYLWNRQYYTKYYSYASVTGTASDTPPATASTVGTTPNNPSTANAARTVHTAGWYALAVYRVDGLQGIGSYLNGLEPLVRYDAMNEDEDGTPWVFTSGSGAATKTLTVNSHTRYRTTVGLNYYFNNYARLMLDYEMIHVDAGLRRASIEPIDLISHRLFTTLLQVKF